MKTALSELQAEAEEQTNDNVRFRTLRLVGSSASASDSDNLQWTTKVVETLLGNDAFRYLSICSILFASSVNSLIPPAPQFNVV